MNVIRCAIEAVGVVKQYPSAERPALACLDLCVRPGELYGLLGPNGAGKTTALAILSGLLVPDRGRVAILGMSPAGKRGSIGKIMALVPQEIALYEELTVRENLSFFGRMFGLHGRMLAERIDSCLAVAALEEFAARRVDSCSGGMRRRLNLVIGLLSSPRVLFLDEPTVGIDAQSKKLIHGQLKRINGQGTTILYTTHHLEEARLLCSKIGIIDAGRLVAEGTPDELLRRHSCATLEEFFLALTGTALRDC